VQRKSAAKAEVLSADADNKSADKISNFFIGMSCVSVYWRDVSQCWELLQHAKSTKAGLEPVVRYQEFIRFLSVVYQRPRTGLVFCPNGRQFLQCFLLLPLRWNRLAKYSLLSLNWRSAVSPDRRVAVYRDKK
jgi:hypothetical protein